MSKLDDAWLEDQMRRLTDEAPVVDPEMVAQHALQQTAIASRGTWLLLPATVLVVLAGLAVRELSASSPVAAPQGAPPFGTYIVAQPVDGFLCAGFDAHPGSNPPSESFPIPITVWYWEQGDGPDCQTRTSDIIGTHGTLTTITIGADEYGQRRTAYRITFGVYVMSGGSQTDAFEVDPARGLDSVVLGDRARVPATTLLPTSTIAPRFAILQSPHPMNQ